MALIECPDCHAHVSDQAIACPHCGHPIPKKNKNKQSTWRWVVGGVLAAFILAGLCTSAANKSQSDSATATSPPAAASPAAKPAVAPTTAPAAAHTTAALLGVGQRASTSEWAAELTSVEPAAKIGNEVPQGRFLVVTTGMTNLHNQTSALNSWDFALKSADGATFSPSGNGDTALAFTPGAPVPVFTIQVQPGLTQPLRIAFDVNPAINQYTFEAARIAFQISLT